MADWLCFVHAGDFQDSMPLFSLKTILPILSAFPAHFKDFLRTDLQLPDISIDKRLVFYVPAAFCPQPGASWGHLQASEHIWFPRLSSLLGQWPFPITLDSPASVTSQHRGDDRSRHDVQCGTLCFPNTFISKHLSIWNPCISNIHTHICVYMYSKYIYTYIYIYIYIYMHTLEGPGWLECCPITEGLWVWFRAHI